MEIAHKFELDPMNWSTDQLTLFIASLIIWSKLFVYRNDLVKETVLLNDLPFIYTKILTMNKKKKKKEKI